VREAESDLITLLILAKLKIGVIILAMEEEATKEVFQSPPDFQSRLSRPKPPTSAKKYIVVIFLIIVVGLLIFGITRIFTGGAGNEENDLTPTPTIEAFPTEEPTPTEDPDVTPTVGPTNSPTPRPTSNPVDSATGLNRSTLSIQILNGSGTAGAGKRASDLLENLGYNVIQVGNADTFDYTQTTIQIKSAEDDFLPLLKKDLSGDYSVGTTSADLAAGSNADAIVIVGKD